jgi:uncharacterized RDD family membrane protein YckC
LTRFKPWFLRRAFVTPETLNVAPAIVGAPLARPVKRLSAMAIDGLVLAVISGLQNLTLGEPLHWGQDLGISVGWAMAYFTLLPYWMPGQTLGKRLLGLQIVELTGRPLSLVLCFSRYGGYAAGLVTGMFGFAQILWDPNRQSIQDKIAHTVVIDLRAPRA